MLKESEDYKILEMTRHDKALFKLVYEKYFEKIYRYSYFKLNFNKEETEDCVADIFIKAYQKVDKIEVRTDIRKFTILPWLYTIARNTIIDCYKSKKRAFSYSKSIDFDEDNINQNYNSKSFEEFVAIELESKKVLNEIRKLPEQLEDILLMKIVEEWSFEEIAENLGLGLSAVKMRYYRAIKYVTKNLKNR